MALVLTRVLIKVEQLNVAGAPFKYSFAPVLDSTTPDTDLSKRKGNFAREE